MTKTLSNSVEQVIYFCLFITVGLFIFIANDATLPLAKILHWQYWVPCMIYSSFVTLFVFGVSQVLKTFMQKKLIVLSLSVCVGTLLGLKSLFALTNWIFHNIGTQNF